MDREKAVKELEHLLNAARGNYFDFVDLTVDEGEEILALLKAQEVVRCKDCKYCIKEPSGELYCDILAVGYEPLGSKKVNEDWFCADGVKRDG